MTQESLNLTPKQVAESFRKAVRPGDRCLGSFGVLANFEPASLMALDRYFEITAGTDTNPKDADFRKNLAMILGCYLGETIRRQTGGQWQGDIKAEGAEHETKIVVLENIELKPLAHSVGALANGGSGSFFNYYLQQIKQLNDETRARIASGFLTQAKHFEMPGAQDAARRDTLALEFYKRAVEYLPSLATQTEARISTLQGKIAAKSETPAQDSKNPSSREMLERYGLQNVFRPRWRPALERSLAAEAVKKEIPAVPASSPARAKPETPQPVRPVPTEPKNEQFGAAVSAIVSTAQARKRPQGAPSPKATSARAADLQVNRTVCIVALFILTVGLSGMYGVWTDTVSPFIFECLLGKRTEAQVVSVEVSEMSRQHQIFKRHYKGIYSYQVPDSAGSEREITARFELDDYDTETPLFDLEKLAPKAYGEMVKGNHSAVPGSVAISSNVTLPIYYSRFSPGNSHPVQAFTFFTLLGQAALFCFCAFLSCTSGALLGVLTGKWKMKDVASSGPVVR